MTRVPKAKSKLEQLRARKNKPEVVEFQAVRGTRLLAALMCAVIALFFMHSASLCFEYFRADQTRASVLPASASARTKPSSSSMGVTTSTKRGGSARSDVRSMRAGGA